MSSPYLCPICHENRTHFTFIYKLAQEVQLDPKTGAPVYEAEDLEAVLRPDGWPDTEVQCMKCNYTAAEQAFLPQSARSRHRRSTAVDRRAQ